MPFRASACAFARRSLSAAGVYRGRVRCLLLVALLLVALPVAADQRVRVLYLHQERAPVAPVSPLDKPAADEGLAGARLAIADTATTSRFGGPSLAMVERPVDQKADQ